LTSMASSRGGAYHERMRFKEALGIYFNGVPIMACGVVVWLLVHSWEWAAALILMGTSTVVAKLWLRRRREAQRQRRYEEEALF